MVAKRSSRQVNSNSGSKSNQPKKKINKKKLFKDSYKKYKRLLCVLEAYFFFIE